MVAFARLAPLLFAAACTSEVDTTGALPAGANNQGTGGSIALPVGGGGNSSFGAAGSSGGAFAGASSSGGTATVGGSGGASTGGTPGAGDNGGTPDASSARGGAVGSGGASSPDGATAGRAAPFKGVANSPCAARTALSVSWYYNWMQTETEPCSDGRGGTFVPMIWGHTGNEQNASSIASSVASFVGHGDEYVLGFNEPDNSTQSNLTVSTAIALWPSFDNAAIKIGSPATQANTSGQAWFGDFASQLAGNAALRADFFAVHWYGWNAGSCDANAAQLESYIRWVEGLPGGRPIWITEWGCLNQSAPDVDTVVRFFNGALAVFDRHPRVVRYAWYPWATNDGLVNGDGTLTALGAAYAAAPATR